MTAPVLTVTLNPALDVAARTPRLVPHAKLRCEDVRYSPGGGGLNVARVLHRLGRPVHAVYASGGSNGDRIGELLEEEGVPFEPVPIADATRSNLAVTEANTGDEFRFVLPGPRMSATEWDRIRNRIEALCPQAGHMVASGSLPLGAPEDAYAQLARIAKRRACRFVLDTAGTPLTLALREGVHTIKPSRGEFLAATGAADFNAALGVAGAWLAAGMVERIAVSLGADGACLLTAAGTREVAATPRKSAASLGAGDAFVAGLVESDIRRFQPAQALSFAALVADCAVSAPHYDGVNLAAVEAGIRQRQFECK